MTNLLFDKRGMTLIEILVVMAIISVLIFALANVLNPAFQIKKGLDSGRKNDLRQYQIALENYANNNSGTYPISTTTVTAKSLCNSGSPPPLGSYMSGCVDDPKIPGNYKYISDTNGLNWVLSVQLEMDSTQYWVICSAGKSGAWTSASPPGSSICPI